MIGQKCEQYLVVIGDIARLSEAGSMELSGTLFRSLPTSAHPIPRSMLGSLSKRHCGVIAKHVKNSATGVSCDIKDIKGIVYFGEASTGIGLDPSCFIEIMQMCYNRRSQQLKFGLLGLYVLSGYSNKSVLIRLDHRIIGFYGRKVSQCAQCDRELFVRNIQRDINAKVRKAHESGTILQNYSVDEVTLTRFMSKNTAKSAVDMFTPIAMCVLACTVISCTYVACELRKSTHYALIAVCSCVAIIAAIILGALVVAKCQSCLPCAKLDVADGVDNRLGVMPSV